MDTITQRAQSILNERGDLLFLMCLILYTGIMASLSLLKLQTFFTTHDIGIFTQSYWTTLYDGRFFYNDLEFSEAGVLSHFGIHVSPVLLLLIPLYAVSPGPEILLIVQSILYGSGAIPLFLAAKRMLGNPSALVVSLVYFLYPALHGANLFDFFEISFLPLLLGFFLYGICFRRMLLILSCGIACLMIKEDVSVLILCASGVGLIRHYREPGNLKWAYTFLILLSILWVIVSFTLIIPGYGSPSGETTGYSFVHQYSSSLPAIQENLYPRGEYLFQLFYPLLFIPALVPEMLIIALPPFAEILLSFSYFDIRYHFSPLVIPILFFATILGLEKIRHRLADDSKGRYRALLIILVVNAVVACLWFSPVMDAVSLVHSDRLHHADSEWFREGTALIPADASIATQPNIYSLLADRASIVEGFRGNPDYIVMHLDMPQSQVFLEDLPVIAEKYTCIYQKGLFYILARNDLPAPEPVSPGKSLRRPGN